MQNPQDGSTLFSGAAARQALLAALIAAAALAAFLPCLRNDFVKWDDLQYVTQNREIAAESWAGPFYAYQGYYHPLTLVTYKLERAVFGLRPLAYHLTNLLLHAACCLLFFRLALRLRFGPAAAFAAALLFAVHPFHAESVAWVSGRKDLLYCLFFCAAGLAYADYAAGGAKKKYFLSLGWFLLALLSKPTAMTVPLALLAMDLRLERKDFSALLAEKAPFAALAGVLYFVSARPELIWGTSGPFLLGAGRGFDASLADRAAAAGQALSFYLSRFFYPAGFCALYPPLDLSGGLLRRFGAPAFFALLTAGLYALRRREGGVFFGWLVFLALLLPALPDPRVLPADRYMYVPLAGLALAAGALWERWYARGPRGAAAAGLAAALLLAGLSARRCGAWRDNLALWSDVAASYPANAEAQDNLGAALAGEKKYTLAIACYDKAISAAPGYWRAYHDRALSYAALGRLDAAVADLTAAIKLKPDSAVSRTVRGLALLSLGRAGPAGEDLRTAVAIDPSQGQAYARLGDLARDRKEFEKAIVYYSGAINADPGDDAALNNRGTLLARTGKYAEAAADFEKAVRLNPGNSGARANLARCRRLLNGR